MANPPDIRRTEVLRYLGHRGQPPGERLDRLIDDTIALCRRLARPKTVYSLFSLAHTAAGEPLLAEAGLVLPGDAIRAHLAGARRAALLAATLGIEVENHIRLLQRTDLTASLVLDAAATALIEAVCDRAGEEIAGLAGEERLCAGKRFSPGYGDLPLALQPDILRALNTGRRIGLTCTDRLILLPRKSVTAVMGLFPPECSPQTNGGCITCDKQAGCPYRAPL